MAQERTPTPPAQKPRRDGLSSSRPSQRSVDDAGTAGQTAEPRSGGVSSEDRSARIAKAAYAKAQQRGFEPGYEWDDWFSAEREIDAEIQALMSRSCLPGS